MSQCKTTVPFAKMVTNVSRTIGKTKHLYHRSNTNNSAQLRRNPFQPVACLKRGIADHLYLYRDLHCRQSSQTYGQDSARCQDTDWSRTLIARVVSYYGHARVMQRPLCFWSAFSYSSFFSLLFARNLFANYHVERLGLRISNIV